MSFFMSFDFYSCYDLFFLMLQMIFNNASTICFHNLHKGCDKLVFSIFRSDAVDQKPQPPQSHAPPPHRPRKTLKPIPPRQPVTSAPPPEQHIGTNVPEDVSMVICPLLPFLFYRMEMVENKNSETCLNRTPNKPKYCL
jgi:hypothetical protein